MPFPPPPPGTLEKVSIPFSSGSSQPRDQTWVSCIGRKILYHLSRQGSLCKQSRHFIFQLRYSLIAFNMKSFSIVSLFVVVWGSAGPELTRDGVFHELFRMLKNISCYLLLLSSVPKIIPFLTLQQGWKVQICSCFKQCAWGWRYRLLNQFSSVQFSPSVVSDSLRPHESQHARPPCSSPTPRVYSNSCPLSRWCHPAISSSVIPFSSCTQSLPASGSFPVSQLFAWGGRSIGVSASASGLPMNTQDWSPIGWTGWISLQSKGLSRVFSNTTVQKHQFLGAQLFTVQLSHPYMTTGKTIGLTRWTFVGQSNVSAF